MKKSGIEDIQVWIAKYFGFLFEKGYKIFKDNYQKASFGDWQVILRSQDCEIEIYSERNEILMAFSKVGFGGRNQIGIEPMIYYLSQGENYIGPFEGNLRLEKGKQFERLAFLLRNYIDEITPFFNDKFEKNRYDLVSVQKEYNELVLRLNYNKKT